MLSTTDHSPCRLAFERRMAGLQIRKPNAQDEDQERCQEALQGDGDGKVKCQASRKRHGMIKRPTKFIRNARGTMVLSDEDAKIVKKNYLPYGR